jgi:uncharacterized integral membrane protein (TIGR00697 family)
MFKINSFDLLVALYVFGIMVAELMGGKTFPIATIGTFHLTASVAIFVLPLLFSTTDIVTEVHGRERSRSIVRAGLLIVLLQIITALVFTALTPSARFAPHESAYDTIFGTSIRFGIASLAAFAAAEFLDVFVFAAMRKKMGSGGLWLRNNASNFASQLVDSTVFMVVAFYSFVRTPGDNIHFLIGIILPYWLVRCTLSVIETPLVYGGVRWLRRSPNADGKNKRLFAGADTLELRPLGADAGRHGR